MKLLFAIMIACLPFTSSASIVSKPESGRSALQTKPQAPNSDSMKTVRGFSGRLIVTSDLDWETKWENAKDSLPQFTPANDVFIGSKLAILTFYSNPGVNKKNEIKVLCDIKVIRPDGSVSINMQDATCGTGKLQGNPRNIFLSSQVIHYVGDKKDPPGIWVVEVTLKDRVNGTDIPLKTQFHLR